MKTGQITCSCGEIFKDEQFATAQAQFVMHQNLLYDKHAKDEHKPITINRPMAKKGIVA